MPLPVVNLEVLFSVQHDIESLGEEFFLEMTKRMAKENPNMLIFMGFMLDFYEKRGQDRGPLSTCMFLLYKLLETQQEVDDLEK